MDEPIEVTKTEGERKLGDFFTRNQQFFTAYSADSSLSILPVPPELASEVDTFAIDLEKGVIYGNPDFFEKMGYDEAKAFFATLHEFEHFRELRELLDEKGGDRVWQKHRKKIKNKKRLHILDNCFDDVRMNRTVIQRAPTHEETKDRLYREDLFPTPDLLSLIHI